MKIDGAALLLFCVLSLVIYASMTLFVGGMNRRVQRRKIAEAKKYIEVFIREVPQITVNEDTNEIEKFIAYQPFFRHPVCGKGQEIEFVDESLMHEFPEDTDYSSHEQVNQILNFWQKKYTDEAKGIFIDHSLRVFRSEEDEKLYWQQTKTRSSV